jgi:hypothetical protein
MGSASCSETSLTNQPTLRQNPEGRRHQREILQGKSHVQQREEQAVAAA